MLVKVRSLQSDEFDPNPIISLLDSGHKHRNSFPLLIPTVKGYKDNGMLNDELPS